MNTTVEQFQKTNNKVKDLNCKLKRFNELNERCLANCATPEEISERNSLREEFLSVSNDEQTNKKEKQK